MSARKQVTKTLANNYHRGNKKAKSQILDELVQLTGWHRDYARTALREALKQSRPRLVRAGRKPTYPADLQPGLILCWAVLRAPASKLLVASMPYLVPKLRAEKALGVTGAQAQLLMKISASTIDRRLVNERKKMLLHGRSHTKPGSLLKSQIPIRTWAEWTMLCQDLSRSIYLATKEAIIPVILLHPDGDRYQHGVDGEPVGA